MSAVVVVAATYVSVILLLFVAFIQIGVSIGIVPITIVWGGSQQTLTTQLRLASMIASIILIMFAYILYQRGTNSSGNSISHSASSSTTTTTMHYYYGLSWFVTIYMILNTIGNLLSTNNFEKYVFGCITAIVAICGIIISSSSSNGGSTTSSSNNNNSIGTRTDGEYTTID